MKRQQGFTLVEMLFTIVLVALCAIVISELFIGQNRIYRSQTAELNIASDARTALDDVDNYTRQAYRVLASYSTYTTGPETLVLSVQAVNSSDQLVVGAYDNIVYYLDGADFYRQVFPHVSSSRDEVTKKLASHVNDLTFTYDNADFALVTEVVTDMTLQQNAGLENRAITVSTKSILRNY
jgi:prepilin-type N-terminal cleavage/methylation domain-containing protein